MYNLDLEKYKNWYNQGNGGGIVYTSAGVTYLKVFTGALTLSAGQDYPLRLRLYVTPFKPLRDDHWNRRFTWWIGSTTMAEGNICHYHQAGWHIPFINYPFYYIERLQDAYIHHQSLNQDMTIYYTLRELSNFAAELPILKSLGDEILLQSGALVADPGGTQVQTSRGGHPWLQEHLVTGYSPAWHVTCAIGEVDAAVGTNGNSRYANYYVEGLSWLRNKVGNVGLYLDQIGYGRETMLRLARVLSDGDPDYHNVYHAGEMFSNEGQNIYWTHTSTLGWSMDHLPFVSQLMFGEAFRYDRSAPWWLVELSGLPFGLDNQYYVNPGPERPFREMVFAGTTCGGVNVKATVPMRGFWDQWGIMGSQMKGWWDTDCPVTTNTADVLATAYVKAGKTLVALASWANQPVDVQITIDWNAIGLLQTQATITAPAITDIQTATQFQVGQAIHIEPGEGWILSIQ